MSRYIVLLTALVASGVVGLTHAAGAEAPEAVREDRDLDNDGRIDGRVETWQISDKLTLKSTDVLDQDTGQVKGRAISLETDGLPFWREVFAMATKTRFTEFEAGSPFAVSCVAMDGSGDPQIMVLDEDHNIVAAFERDQDGRLAPASEETLDQAQAVAEAFMGAVKDALSQDGGVTDDSRNAPPDDPSERQ